MQSIKCVLVGDGDANKTDLLVAYTTDAPIGETKITVFDNYSANVMIDGAPVNIGLWDTAGQTEFDRLRPFTYPGTDIFLLVFALDSPSSLASITDRWNPEVNHHCPGATKILVGTNLHLKNDPATIASLRAKHQAMVTTEQAQKVMRDIGADKYLECSSMTLVGVYDVFDKPYELFYTTRRLQNLKSCSN